MPKVLVADDDPDIRELIAFKLEQAGYEIQSVGDGSAALRAIIDSPPSVAVLDVLMPGMSGLDICRRVRADPSVATLPIILLTSRAQESDVENGFMTGADDYVVKPFSPRELLNRIRILVARDAPR